MNFMKWSQRPEDEPRDSRMNGWLSEVDPGHDDATYWMRFHRSVTEGARLELARRRREADVTVTGIVSAWSRTLVPAALAAAAAAGIMLAQPPAELSESPMMVEDVLSLGLTDPIPAELDEDGFPGPDGLLLAAEVY